MGSGVSGEGRSEKGRLYCPTCKVTVNSASQLQAHNTGECGPPTGVRGKEKGGETTPHQMGAAGISGRFAQGLGHLEVVLSCYWACISGPPTNA